MSFSLQQFEYDLNREVTYHTRSLLTTEKPQIENSVRNILNIRHDITDKRPIHDRNIVYLVMCFMNKHDLGKSGCVSAAWRVSANCPSLWRRIFELDLSIGLDKQLFSKEENAEFIAKAYYMSQHTKMRAAVSQVSHRLTHEQFMFARGLFFINFLLPA